MKRYIAYIIVCIVGCIYCQSQVSDLWRSADRARNNGEYKQAVMHYTSMINLLSKDDETRRLAAFSNRAYCYKQLELYNLAIEDYDNAIQLASADELKAIKLNKSDLLIQIGQYNEAEKLLNTISSTEQEIYTHKIANISTVLQLKGQIDEAIALLDSLICSCEDEKILPILYQNRAYANMSLVEPQYDCAINDFDASLNSLSGLNRYIALSNKALAEAYMNRCQNAIGDITAAYNWINSNLGENHPEYLRTLRKKAEIYLISNNLGIADRLYHQYLYKEQKSLISNIVQMQPTQKLSYWAKEKPLLSKCFQLEDYDAEFLFEVAMFRRQTSLLGMRDTDNLKKLLCVKPAQIRNVLKSNEAAVEIVSYEPERNKCAYAAIVLPKTGKARFIRLIDEADFYEAGRVGNLSLLEAIENDYSEDKNILYNDSTLGNKIWQPIMDVLPKNVTKIYFAPEGIFHMFAIENMPFDGKDGKEFHRVTSIASLINRNAKTTKKTTNTISAGNTLVIGGLDYDKAVNDSIPSANREAAEYLKSQFANRSNLFKYLEGTKAEVDSISKALSKPVRYEISESELKNILPDFDVVHIATHGYSLNVGIRKRPEFLADSIPYDKSLIASGLALTGANKTINSTVGEDELLSAREICDLDLSNVDFVVLSACQTAQGDISDEGAAGLVRGLKNAGVKTILATLWSVNDESTMLFMQEFYKQIKIGKSKYLAFIAAQNFVRNYEKEVTYRRFSSATLAIDRKVTKIKVTYNAPYYWAPFILIDEY